MNYLVYYRIQLQKVTQREFNVLHQISSKFKNVLDSKWAKLLKNRAFTLLPSLVLGTTIWFGVTATDELTVTAIHLLAVFTRFVVKYPFFFWFICLFINV